MKRLTVAAPSPVPATRPKYAELAMPDEGRHALRAPSDKAARPAPCAQSATGEAGA